MDSELKGFLDRIAGGIEKLSEEPTVNFEITPILCPHCNFPDPNVKIPVGADGPISECILQVTCLSCEQRFFAIPLAWSLQPNAQLALAEIEQRKGGGNDNGGHTVA